MMTRLFVTLTSCLTLVSASSGYVQGAGPHQQPSGGALRLQQQPSEVRPVASRQRALLDRYCVTCHNQKLKTAGLTLDTMDVAHVSTNAAVWEKVVRKVRAGVMPPAGRPRPDRSTYEGFASWLENELDRGAAG